MRGAKCICVGDVGVDDVWVVCVSVDGACSTVSPNILLISVGLTHGALGMFDFIFWFRDCTDECSGYYFCCVHRFLCCNSAMFGVKG